MSLQRTLLEANPLFRRESRGRWRDSRSFLLLGLYAIAVAVVVVFFYGLSAVENKPWMAFSSHQTGREIFLALSAVQLGAIFLIVPALASTSVAYERERGLLEALQLSELSAWRIVAGKLCGVLAYALLFWLCGVPALAICFMLGGIALDDFACVLALHAVSMVSCAAVGLWLSSRARRPVLALRNTFVFVALWLALTWPDSAQWWTWTSLSWTLWWQVTAWGIPNDWLVPLRDAGQVAPGANPFTVLGQLAEDRAALARNPLLAQQPALFFIHLGFQAALALLCLWRATVNVRRPFTEAPWLERKRHLRVNFRLAQAKAPDKLTRQSQRRIQRRRELLDTPLLYLLRFGNPVLQREIREPLRLRTFGKPAMCLLRVVAVLALVLCAWALLWVWIEPLSRAELWPACVTLLLAATMLFFPLRGAASLVREREKGTWESLRLSQLTPLAILWGKIAAPLFLLGAVVTLLSPLWIPCIQWTTLSGDVTRYHNGVPLDAALAALALIFATAFCYVSWGAWISAHSRNTSTAVAWTLGTILVVTFFSELVMDTVTPFFGYSGNGAYGATLLRPWDEWQTLHYVYFYGEQPWGELFTIATTGAAPTRSFFVNDGSIPYPLHTFVAALLLLGIGTVLFLSTWRRLQREWRALH